LLLAVATILNWWYLSDYYMAHGWRAWQPWMDCYGFMVASFAALLGIAAFCRLQTQRLGIHPANRKFVKQALPVDVWRDMLQLAVVQRKKKLSRLARHFMRWQIDRLSSPMCGPLTADEVFSPWATGGRSILLVWLRSCWLLGLWFTLSFIPLHTNIMETAASALSGYQNRIFAVLAKARGVKGEPVRESLQEVRGNEFFRSDTVFLARGSFTIRATDFPRVYRRIHAKCAGKCVIHLDESSSPEVEVDLRLRAGASSFEFIQSNPEPRLNLRIWLMQRDGTVLDNVTIEPLAARPQ